MSRGPGGAAPARAGVPASSTCRSRRSASRTVCGSRSPPAPGPSTPWSLTWVSSRWSRTPSATASGASRRRAGWRSAPRGWTKRWRSRWRTTAPACRPEAAPSPEVQGIGLANTRARLRQLYGDAASLTLENGANGGAVATLTLPYRADPDPAAPVAEELEVHALEAVDR